jgi:AraC-like DNA-binding protein
MPIDELRELIERHAQDGATSGIEGVLVSRVATEAHASTSMSGTVFALIAQGSKRLGLGGTMYEYGAGQYLVASVDLPVTGNFVGATPKHPALGFGLILRPTVIASLLLEQSTLERRGRTGVAPPGIAVSNASTELVGAAVRMMRLLDDPDSIPVLAPLIEREILWRLITGEQGAAVRQLGLADSSLAHISRAVRWIRAHYAERFQVEDLARLSGMSVSAFHRNFVAVTAMSPIQFQKQMRLQEARLLLVAEATDVSGVGHAVGYDSASQFSREYRRQFGTPPGRDALRLRSSGPMPRPQSLP